MCILEAGGTPFLEKKGREECGKRMGGWDWEESKEGDVNGVKCEKIN